jgi:triosephosphate isomerase (TIM)
LQPKLWARLHYANGVSADTLLHYGKNQVAARQVMQAPKLIVGNWKMNGVTATLAEAKAVSASLVSASSDNVRVVICPPATLIARASDVLSEGMVLLGGQDCHAKVEGAHTGDVSAHMLADVGATYVIVGHSERRSDHGETSANVASKAKAAIVAGLMPIICVGESEAQRDAGQAEAIVLDQILGSIPSTANATQICIAYEPVWAIGTGRTPSVEEVAAMHVAIRQTLVGKFGDADGKSIAILYGGSVNPKNAAELLGTANVDGALVGGASLTAANFLGIITTQL